MEHLFTPHITKVTYAVTFDSRCFGLDGVDMVKLKLTPNLEGMQESWLTLHVARSPWFDFTNMEPITIEYVDRKGVTITKFGDDTPQFAGIM